MFLKQVISGSLCGIHMSVLCFSVCLFVYDGHCAGDVLLTPYLFQKGNEGGWEILNWREYDNKILTMFLKVIFFPFYFLFYQIKKMYLSLSAFPVLYIFLSSKQNIKENV